MLVLGEQFTMAGRYKRRTFLQWIRQEPKQLKQYTVIDQCESYSKYEEVK